MKRLVRIENRTRSTELGDRIQVADRWWLRLRGLLGRTGLARGEGLLIIPCKAVHMLGMRIALDVIVLDRDARVLAIYPGLLPGGRTGWHQGARSVLELPTGTLHASHTGIGDELSWV